MPNSREFYFRNDSEVAVKANATDDETGMSYGATLEIETDTDMLPTTLTKPGSTSPVVSVKFASVTKTALPAT